MSQLCKIVPERCIACGLCNVYAPEIFDYDEDGIVLFAQEPEAHQQFVTPENEESMLAAYRKCPVRAIVLEK
jgi:Ferredoxin